MFEILYHYLVVREDMPRISKLWREKIRTAIEDRLVAEPDLYGKPLRRSLKGYRKLRVGDYRIIFKIDERKVKILIIQHRSAVYAHVKKRKFNF